MQLTTLGAALQLVAFALAAPTTRSSFPDAPFSVNSSTVESAIYCPRGLSNSPIFLLVHGTGGTGNGTWPGTPYNIPLSMVGTGNDICWIDLPGLALGDVQISAEYVARGVQFLAPMSSNGQVVIIGHSQGAGINPQWALTFWPSIQPLVRNFIALAGDFHGTSEGRLFCGDVTFQTCNPAFWQQTIGSNYLNAQNSMAPGGGGRALVPTTSIYTKYDDVIQPEMDNPTSFLAGADVHSIQDLCGFAHVADHGAMILDPAVYFLVLLALESSGPVDLSKFDKGSCFQFGIGPLARRQLDLSAGAPLLPAPAPSRENARDTRNDSPTPGQIPAEPLLQPYVCARNFAANCGPAFTPNFFTPNQR